MDVKDVKEVTSKFKQRSEGTILEVVGCDKDIPEVFGYFLGMATESDKWTDTAASLVEDVLLDKPEARAALVIAVKTLADDIKNTMGGGND